MTPTLFRTKPRIRIGSSVTPTDHRAGQYQGTVVVIGGPWARVLWSLPVQGETIEWLPTLKTTS
jgi:hypothetical protein